MKRVLLYLMFMATAFASVSAQAAFINTFSATNGTGVFADDFHATFTGTGGTVSDILVTVDAPGSAAPTTTSSPSLNDVFIEWSGNPNGVGAGESISVQFTTDFDIIGVDSAFWTASGINIGNTTLIDLTSVETVPIPAAAWLFGSGLIGLIGVARRKKA